MNLPGRPIHSYTPDDDDRAFARWMLGIVDESPDRLAIMQVPPARTDEELDQLEDATRRAFDLAQQERTNLTARTIPGRNVVTGARRILLELHEHQWVGGECVRGCGERRQVRPVDGSHGGK